MGHGLVFLDSDGSKRQNYLHGNYGKEMEILVAKIRYFQSLAKGNNDV